MIDFWSILFLFENNTQVKGPRFKAINGDASFRCSFGPHFALVSIESTTIFTTHPSLGNHSNDYSVFSEVANETGPSAVWT